MSFLLICAWSPCERNERMKKILCNLIKFSKCSFSHVKIKFLILVHSSPISQTEICNNLKTNEIWKLFDKIRNKMYEKYLYSSHVTKFQFKKVTKGSYWARRVQVHQIWSVYCQSKSNLRYKEFAFRCDEVANGRVNHNFGELQLVLNKFHVWVSSSKIFCFRLLRDSKTHETGELSSNISRRENRKLIIKEEIELHLVHIAHRLAAQFVVKRWSNGSTT